jgi:thiamine pyrophosphokinase
LIPAADNTALLVIGGDAPPFASLQPRLHEFSFVCAADSGLDVLRRWGIRPDLVVGDMDSLLDTSILAGYNNVLEFPRDKDETDTEIGLRELRSRGHTKIVMAGGGGGRLDHLLALRSLLERPEGPDEWITAAEQVVRLSEAARFSVPEGSTVSVFPLSGGAEGMHSEGLKWPLDGLIWDNAHFGVSNVALTGDFLVVPGPQPLFVVLPL